MQPFQQINHLVVLMMENRSFDHFLGSLQIEGRADVDGIDPAAPVQLPDNNGVLFSQFPLDGTYKDYGDPPHGRAMQEANYADTAMDGFVKSYQTAFPNGTPAVPRYDIPMGYYTRPTLPVLYSLADHFKICDRWFSSMLSSTWPNKKYFYSGCRDEDDDTESFPVFGFKTTPFLSAVEQSNDPDTGQPLTWKSYFSDLPFSAFWLKFAATHLKNYHPIEAFAADCQNGTLPTISIIDPPYGFADDHPSYDVRMGQKFLGLIVDALTHSDSWQDTALVLLYDENGAFYDHVCPPASFESAAGLVEPTSNYCTQDNILGFRVPAVVISPYSGGLAVHSADFDHTSIMASINQRWGVDFPEATYGNRWKLAPTIWDHFFDWNATPLGTGTYTQPVASVLAGDPAPFEGLSWESGIHEIASGPLGGVIDLLGKIFIIPMLNPLDRRAKMFDSLHTFENNVMRQKQLANRDPSVALKPQ